MKLVASAVAPWVALALLACAIWGSRDERASHAASEGGAMNELARSTVSPAKLATMWNKRFPVGTKVRYWTGSREGSGKESVTTTEARLLSGHTAVVWLQDVSGCVALSHVEPLP